MDGWAFQINEEVAVITTITLISYRLTASHTACQYTSDSLRFYSGHKSKDLIEHYLHMTGLKFAAFSSDIELPFYTSLASHKINHDKLDDSARRLLGLYELKPSEDSNISCRMQIRGNALTSDELVDTVSCVLSIY